MSADPLVVPPHADVHRTSTAGFFCIGLTVPTIPARLFSDAREALAWPGGSRR